MMKREAINAKVLSFFIFPHFADFVQNIHPKSSFEIADLLYPTFLVELTVCPKLQL